VDNDVILIKNMDYLFCNKNKNNYVNNLKTVKESYSNILFNFNDSGKLPVGRNIKEDDKNPIDALFCNYHCGQCLKPAIGKVLNDYIQFLEVIKSEVQ